MSRELAALIRMGKNALSEADCQRAERQLMDALVSGMKYPDVHYTLGLIEHQRGRYHNAVEQFEKAIEMNPRYTEALLSLSVTLNDMGRYDDARAAYDRAAEEVAREGGAPGETLFRGRVANLHKELGELYLALGRPEDAVAEYRKALSIAPRYPDLRVGLAGALRESGRWKEAQAEIDAFLAQVPGNPKALVEKGILHFLAGEKASARSAWEEALYRDPRNRIVQVYLNTLDREGGPS